MALKSLFLGVLFSMGIFAVKSGFGLNYYLGTCSGIPKRVWGTTLFTVLYGLIFIACTILVTTTDLMAWFPLFQIIISHAMTLHFFLAVLMCIWSLALIRKKKGNKNKTRGWMLLALPCPVCMVVIFLSVAFFAAYVPEHVKETISLLFLGFMILNLSTLGALYRLGKRTHTPPDHLLGGAMLFIALYFLLSVIIMPQFSGIEEIYSLSLHGSPPGQDLLMEKRWTFTLLTLLFMGGTLTAMSQMSPSSFFHSLVPAPLPWKRHKNIYKK
ncbi:Predicted transporter [Desulfocicer vacuolatum DSM 3385]|uniref:Predicted transporter n=1 Tax=Desulfocicer vacuolatum DSM 3385 TaxID=1121400 RepID=A0A1W1YT84_9BACT|nr:DUF2162 domain-containing protein [Desulfocicer vacuolatum]SMC39354.1 Predicted transporter [Desulfocicer vacuolatum DSM 3385]